MGRLPIIQQPVRTSDQLAYWTAVGFGAGFSPVGPGTCGALEAIALFGALTLLPAPAQMTVLVLLNAVALVVGIWASGRTAELTGVKDPKAVVIDEISGQLIALLPVGFTPSLTGVIAAFVLFRVFDIFKPYPIGRLERLKGGYGVMMDDVAAGVIAALLVWLGTAARLV